MKIVIIGAGSISFGRGQIADILQAKELNSKEKPVILSLVDINEKRLERTLKLAEKIKKYLNSSIKLEATTDRTKALKGANYVIISVAINRMPLWEQDFRIPIAFGFKHNFGENGGPGALFHALRNFELIIPICKDIEKICPNAQVFNFTNPEARILHAISHLTKVKAIGLCHGVFMGIDFIAKMLKRHPSEFEVRSAGRNHLYVCLKDIAKKTGNDILPEIKKKALKYKNSPPLFKKILEIFDVFVFPEERHIGEYFSFGSNYSGIMWEFGIESYKITKRKNSSIFYSTSPWMFTEKEIEKYISGEKKIDNKIISLSGEIAIPIICDIEFNRKNRYPAINIVNQQKLIENLPEHGVIEIPAKVDGKGIHPEKIGKIPEPFAAFIRRQHEIHLILTEAYRLKSKKMLLQALLLDPYVDNIPQAEKMLDYFLWIQKDFLPEFN